MAQVLQFKPIMKAQKIKVPRHTKNVLVTQEMLYEFRSEVKHEFSSLRFEMDSKFKQMESRFTAIDSKFKAIDGRFDSIDSKLEKVLAEVHRIGLVVEEQNNRNKIVLDGYLSLDERLSKLDGGI